MEIKLCLVLLAIIPYSAFLRFFIGVNNRRRKNSKQNIKFYILYLRSKADIDFCAIR